MKVFLLSLAIGMSFGVIDIIPMILKRLNVLFIISDFLHWTLAGLFFSYLNLPFSGILKGIIITLLISLPTMPLIFKFDKPALPIVFMTNIILGGLLSFVFKIIQR